MERDNLTHEQALKLTQEAKSMLQHFLDDGLFDEAYEIFYDMFDLEPDYLEDLI
jgi:hypothetical protein